MTRYFLNNFSGQDLTINLTATRVIKAFSSFPMNDTDVKMFKQLKANRYGQSSMLDNLVISTIRIEDDSRYAELTKILDKEQPETNDQSDVEKQLADERAKVEKEKAEAKAKAKAEKQAKKEAEEQAKKEAEEQAKKDEEAKSIPEKCQPCYADGKTPSEKDCEECKAKAELEGQFI